MNRRFFLRQMALALGSFSLSACGLLETPVPSPTPNPTQTPSPSETATSTPYPTRTATPTSTPTPTATPTPTPVLAGTLAPGLSETISEANLNQVVELARWGKGSVEGLAWSPSGSRLAAATDLGIYLYDPRTYQQVGFLNAGPTRQVAFFPSGTPLFSAGDAMFRWDVQSGQSQAMALLPNPLAMGVSADGARIGVLSQPPGQAAQFQRSDNGSIVILKKSSQPLTAAVFSSDLGLIAAHEKASPPRIWRSDGEVLLDLPAAKQAPGPLAFAPDGRSIAVGFPDTSTDFLNTNLVRVFSLPDGQVRYDLLPEGGVEGAEESLLSLVFSPDGKRIAAGFGNNTVRVWRAEAGPVERKLIGKGLPATLAFSPDGLLLAGGGLDFWQISDGVLLGSISDHLSPLHDLVLSPRGDLAALAMFEQIELRQISDGSLLRSIPTPKQVNGLSFSPDGSLLCGACSDGTARLWRVQDGRYLTLIGEPTQRLWASAFSPDGKIIIFGGENGLIQFYEIEKDQVTRQVREPYIATRLAFSPVGTLFASLTSAGVNIRDLNGNLTRSTAGVGLQDLSFSPDGGWLALAGNEILRVFDLGTGKDVYSLYDPARGQPSALAFSPDGAFLAVGREDGRVDFFWAGDGSYLRTLSGHRGRVIRLGFTPATRQLVSAGQDGTIRVWGLGRT